MADVGQVLIWELFSQESISAEDVPLKKGVLKDFADDRLFLRAIRVGKLQDQLQTEFVWMKPIWLGLWVKSPLTTVQCSILYDLFSLFTVREDRLCRNLNAFLEALQDAYSGKGQLKVSLTPPGHTDFGTWTTFAHCPQCKIIAPVPAWDASEYHDEISCPICNTRYVPSEMYSKKDDLEEARISQDHPPKKQNPILSKFFLSRFWFYFALPWFIAFELFRSARFAYAHQIRVRRRPHSIKKSASVSRG